MSFIIHIFGAQKVNFLRLGKNLQILHEQVELQAIDTIT